MGKEIEVPVGSGPSERKPCMRRSKLCLEHWGNDVFYRFDDTVGNERADCADIFLSLECARFAPNLLSTMVEGKKYRGPFPGTVSAVLVFPNSVPEQSTWAAVIVYCNKNALD